MKGTQLLKSYHKTKNSGTPKAYKNKETIFCRRQECNFYNNLDTRLLIDNKTFWKTI